MSNDVQTKISKCLIGFFASFNAEMLPPPSTNPEVLKDIENTQKHKQLEPAFVQGVQRVCQRIIELYSPKKGFVEGSNVDGASQLYVIIVCNKLVCIHVQYNA